MQKVIYRDEIKNYQDQIDQSIINYLDEGLIETFEGFDHYILAAFDWYDISNITKTPSQIIVYLDESDIFVICENKDSYLAACSCFAETESNEKAMHLFFKNLFKKDTKYLEGLEDRISDLDDSIIDGTEKDAREKIVDTRYEILCLKKYYEQFELIFDELCDNDIGLLSKQGVTDFEILGNRTDKLKSSVMNLREFIVQVRESYQAQIDIEQNRIMKIFTLVTSIFMPLSLIAGWYGMNLKMPEFEWTYSYPVIGGACVLICCLWFVIFKKTGWFK